MMKIAETLAGTKVFLLMRIRARPPASLWFLKGSREGETSQYLFENSLTKPFVTFLTYHFKLLEFDLSLAGDWL